MTKSPGWAQFWTVLRAAVAVLILAAVIAQLQSSISYAVTNDQHVDTVTANFFSYFTILSNVLAIVVLAWAAIWFWTRGTSADVEPHGLALALASATTYMVVTGIVYNLLLRGYPLTDAVVPWSNEVLHVIGPIFLLADLFVGSRRRELKWSAILIVLVFPLVWVVYTLLRAPLVVNPATGDPYWYPYPFLNPNYIAGGWAGVIGYIIGIAIGIGAIAAITVWIGRRRGVQPGPLVPADEVG